MSQRHSIHDFSKIAILGSSRGFGASLYNELSHYENKEFLLVSRKIEQQGVELQNELQYREVQLSIDLKNKNNKVLFNCDFSKLENCQLLKSKIIEFKPDIIFYIAGGGPYGRFEDKKWADHLWAYNVNLLFPAQLYHELLALKKLNLITTKIIIFIGSDIADNKPDPLSASYSSAKHGLRGLINSIQYEQPLIESYLYSPGYMDTKLLPPNATPRHQTPDLVVKPEHEVKKLIKSIFNNC